MPEQMFRLAAEEGIRVEYWDFGPGVEGIYHADIGLQPVIGLSDKLCPYKDVAHFRTVLGEELGHHFTTAGNHLPVTYASYSERLIMSKAERLALKWAAEYLVPNVELEDAMSGKGIIYDWEIAEYFRVDQSLVEFRFNLLSDQQKSGIQQELVEAGIIEEYYYWEY